MSLCFLVGSEKVRGEYAQLKFFLSVEYLNFDFDKENVQITADFFCRNISAKPAKLYGLHRGGALDFNGFSGDWSKSDQGKLFKKLVPSKYEMHMRWGKPVLWVGGVHKYREFKNVPCNNPNKLIVENPASKDPFSMFISDDINPSEDAIIRMSTLLEKDVYNKLVKDEGASIVGGTPLEKKILEDLNDEKNQYPKKYLETFNNFVDKFREHPDKYYFFIEVAKGNKAYAFGPSVETTVELKNYKIDKGRYVTWCSSDNSFYQYRLANTREPSFNSAKEMLKSQPVETLGPSFEIHRL